VLSLFVYEAFVTASVEDDGLAQQLRNMGVSNVVKAGSFRRATIEAIHALAEANKDNSALSDNERKRLKEVLDAMKNADDKGATGFLGTTESKDKDLSDAIEGNIYADTQF